jgi:hypothetical protein
MVCHFLIVDYFVISLFVLHSIRDIQECDVVMTHGVVKCLNAAQMLSFMVPFLLLKFLNNIKIGLI